MNVYYVAMKRGQPPRGLNKASTRSERRKVGGVREGGKLTVTQLVSNHVDVLPVSADDGRRRKGEDGVLHSCKCQVVSTGCRSTRAGAGGGAREDVLPPYAKLGGNTRTLYSPHW